MRRLALCAAVITLLGSLTGYSQPAPAHRQLLIVLDGLRPDYVTPAQMPTLSAFAARGVTFVNHHSVFPTVTRVNASSMASGAYPDAHGLMGNTVFFPQVDPRRFLNTESRSELERVQAATNGRLLTATTIGGVLQAAGMKMLVVSAGSGGSAYLLNDNVSGGAIINTEYTLPATLHPRVVETLGAVDEAALTSAQKNTRAVDAFFKVGLPAIDPQVTVMWLTDPDTTAHAHGIGHPETVAALKALDGEITRVLDGLDARGLTSSWNVWVTSDHGFSTSVGAPDVAAILKPHERALPDGSPRIVSSGGAIYVRDNDAATVTAIATALQRTPGVGAIFTRGAQPGAAEGSVRGTLSFDSIHWAHERSAQILYAGDWTDQANAYGVKGTSAVGGVATHGNSSPYDIHNILFAAGPDLKRGATVTTPSGNVDFAPTFLAMLKLPQPPSVYGRVLSEALSASGAAPQVQTRDERVSTASGDYVLSARFSVVQAAGKSHRYLDWTKVERKVVP